MVLNSLGANLMLNKTCGDCHIVYGILFLHNSKNAFHIQDIGNSLLLIVIRAQYKRQSRNVCAKDYISQVY